MPTQFPDIMMRRGWIPGRPLLGVTLLLVEDSRFASEGVRLLCQRLGIRIRRADTLAAARRHLQTYLPTVILIDLGLPDGAGGSLIAELANATPRIPAILATSGDDGAEARALADGADGFLAKPVLSLSSFQAAITAHLPDAPQHVEVRTDGLEFVEPDTFALRDDIMHAADILALAEEDQAVRYVIQFIGGVARASRDMPLQRAVESLDAQRATGRAIAGSRSQLATMLDARIAAAAPV